jgi:hypothetical protein
MGPIGGGFVVGSPLEGSREPGLHRPDSMQVSLHGTGYDMTGDVRHPLVLSSPTYALGPLSNHLPH